MILRNYDHMFPSQGSVQLETERDDHGAGHCQHGERERLSRLGMLDRSDLVRGQISILYSPFATEKRGRGPPGTAKSQHRAKAGLVGLAYLAPE